ncbi:MAG TPA: hypothetical protein VIY49_11095 [Bryobacteraceae bacterium]
MRYAIVGFGPGSAPVEISEEEYRRVRLAKQKILRSLAVEDKFDLVVTNYEDFEREILGLALHQMVYSDLSWSSMHSDRQTLNRRVLNLLSAGRLYIDQVMHDTSEDPPLAERIRKKAWEQYDTRLGYRVMEALRNYTQHRALSVDQLSFSSSWVPPGELKHLEYRAEPFIALQALREDERVKRSVVADLEPIGPDVPLTPLIRDYVEGLSVIHQEFRECAQGAIPTSEASFNWVWERCNAGSGSRQKAARILESDADGTWTSEDHIFQSLIAHRNDLVTKNQALTNLARRYVSGACELTGN